MDNNDLSDNILAEFVDKRKGKKKNYTLMKEN